MIRWVLLFALFCLCGVGCGPDTNYSGVFSVTNQTDKDIKIKDWSGFGRAQPGRGYIVSTPSDSGGTKSSSFPRLNSFPDETTVIWTDQEGNNEQSQTIVLRGVVPRGEQGATNFTLKADGKWSVRFVPGTPVGG